jgi:hypothetical protein
MGRIRWGSHHDHLRPFEYSDRKFLEEPSDQADEVQGQAFAFDERIVGEHQEVLQYPTGPVMTVSHDANPMFPEFSIKLYAWEHAFLRRVLFVRNEEELKMLRKIGIFTVRICQPMGSLPYLDSLEYRP